MKKFKRPLFWVQRALDVVGVSTSLPDHVDELVRPQLEALGWDRYRNVSVTSVSNPLATTVNGPVCPDGTAQLVLAASVHHGDAAAHNLWIEKTLGRATASPIGISAVALAVPALVKIPIQRHAILFPGDRLTGKTDVILGAGSLVLNVELIAIAIGEYMAHPPL